MKKIEEEVFNYDIYFISLMQVNHGYNKFSSLENGVNKVYFIKTIKKDSYGNLMDEEIIIQPNENEIKIEFSEYHMNNYIQYFKSTNNKTNPEQYIKKIILEDFTDFIKLDENKDYYWKINNVIDFEKNGKEKIDFKEQFHKKEYINEFRNRIEDEYLKQKHICLNPNCTSENKTPCKSHYISSFILKNLCSENSKEILKCYPFDIINEDVKYSRNLVSDFVLLTNYEQNLYNTARIYCGACDNSLFSNFENSESFFNSSSIELYPNIIDLLSMRFIDFIKVKNKEFEILGEGLDFIKDNNNNTKENIYRRKEEIQEIFNIITKKVENPLNLKIQFEVNTKIPFAGMTFIKNENIRRIFSFLGDFNLKNIDLNNGFLILNILPKKNTSIITFHFFNLNYFEYCVISTFFIKNVINKNNENIKDFLKFCFTSMLINFGEIFMSKHFFDSLSFNKKQSLLNCFLLKDYSMIDYIDIEYCSDKIEISNVINDRIKKEPYFKKEKVIDLISGHILNQNELCFLQKNIFNDENLNKQKDIYNYIVKKISKIQNKVNQKTSACGELNTYQIIHGYKKVFEIERKNFRINDKFIDRVVSKVTYTDTNFINNILKKYEFLDIESLNSLLLLYCLKSD